MELQERLQVASKTMDKVKLDKQYKDKMAFPRKWASFEKMRSGDQWGAVTEKTKNYPRPVFNVIDSIINHKVAAVSNENIKMVFSHMELEEVPEGQTDFADLYSRYSETVWENIKQDLLNERALNNAANLGSGIWHYYWNDKKTGGMKLEYIGEMEGETIDPMNIGFGNPQCLDVQRQPWIVIRSREEVENIKEEAKENGASEEELELLKSDKETQESEYEEAQTEVDNNKANVYTMYFKKKVPQMKNYPDGTRILEMKEHIFFLRVCNGVLVKEETDTDFEVYPVVVMNWLPRKECIYGRGDTEGIIPNQRAINLLIAMQINSAVLMGFPKLVYKKGSVDPTKITNSAGELIEDNSKLNGFGLQYLTPASMPMYASELSDKILQFTKDLKGATESNTGELKGNLNATAISLLQQASAVPIESIRKRFYQAMEDVGRVWEQFFKKKYVTARIVTVKDDDNKEQAAEFRGSEADGIEFKLKIDVGSASAYSETFMLNSLDRFLDNGLISFEQYLKYVPKNVVPFKDSLLRDIQEQQMMAQEQAKQQIISMMNPAERQAFEMAQPEQQQAIIQELMNREQAMQMQQQQPQQQPKPQAAGSQPTNKPPMM